MRLLRDYARLLIFAAGLLLGVQIPGFVDQYSKRVDAHWREAEFNFAGFQRTADKHFAGDVDAMIAHHRKSGDVVFQEDADSIDLIWKRVRVWRAEKSALEQTYPLVLWHIIMNPNSEAYDETRQAFSHTVPLNQTAIVCGLLTALILAMCIDLVLALLGRALRTLFR